MSARILSCPRCPGEPLGVLEHDRHEVDSCGSCRGLWLDAAEWAPLMGPLASPARLAALPGGSSDMPPCPACTVTTPLAPRLQARMLVGAADVVIDACPTCHGAWLDGGELAQLRRSLAASRVRASEAAPPSVPEPARPVMPQGPGPKDAGRYMDMGSAMLATLVALGQASMRPRRRGLFGRRRRRSGGGLLFTLLLRLLRR